GDRLGETNQAWISTEEPLNVEGVEPLSRAPQAPEGLAGRIAVTDGVRVQDYAIGACSREGDRLFALEWNGLDACRLRGRRGPSEDLNDAVVDGGKVLVQVSGRQHVARAPDVGDVRVRNRATTE